MEHEEDLQHSTSHFDQVTCLPADSLAARKLTLEYNTPIVHDSVSSLQRFVLRTSAWLLE